MTAPLVASAPGKVILMGEHAVVYGRPSLVAALGLRVRARLGTGEGLAPGEVELCLPDVGCRVTVPWDELRRYVHDARERWRRHRAGDAADRFEAVRGDDPAHVVKVALGEASRAAGLGAPSSGLRLEVASDLPVGGGFGSSAAVGAAASGAWLAWHGASLTDDRRERLLLEIERRQHGSPSGVDGATVLRGGTLWVEPKEEGGLRIRRSELAPNHLARLRVVDTGTPAQDTGAVVAEVRRRRRDEPGRIGPILDRMGETTRRFRRALSDSGRGSEAVGDLVRSYQRDLEALGVVPGPARRLVRQIEDRGGAAKISGAGALSSPPDGPPAAGAMLVYHPEPRVVGGWEALAGLPVYDVRVGAGGFRLEAGA